MKKIFLFLVTFVGIVACSKSSSSSDDDGGSGSVAGYNPPSWIIGTWISDLTKTTGYSFTKKDYCITAGTTLCYLSGSMKQTVTKVEQEIKGDIYTLSIEVEGSLKTPVSFKRISANQIAKLNLAGEIEYTFTKKK